MARETNRNENGRIAADAYLAAIVDSSDDGIISKDLTGRITSWNKAAERIFGYHAAEVIGQSITLLIPPDHLDEEPEILQRLRRGERIEHYETVRMRKDGTRIDVSLTISPIFNGATVVGASKIIRDITERKLADRRLEEERARLQVTLSSIGDGVIVTDPKGHLQFLNPVAEALTGWKQKDAEGQPLETVFNIINERTRERVENPVRRALREGLIVGLANHTVLQARDGVEYAIDDSAAPIRAMNGEVSGVVLVFRDVTGARAAEDFRARLAAIVESSDDAIVGKDLTGRITSWNRGAERIFGYTQQEVIGRSLILLIPPDRLSEETEILGRIQRGERVDHFETVRIAKDHRKVYVSLTVSPIRDAEGTVVGASKIARDITERKNSERKLAEAQEQLKTHSEELEKKVEERTTELRDALAELETFSFSISHDLRAPLRAMHGFAQILVDEHVDQLDDEGKRMLERIVRSSARLSTLIHDVLAYSQIRREAIDVRAVALDKLVPQIIDEYPNLKQRREEIRIRQPLLSAMGNESLLTQCVSNLLGNAIKFIPAGGKPEIEVWTERQGSNVRLWIEDNGIGIAPDDQKRLFQLFSRVGNQTQFEGTGIGLAIVQRAVNRMRGTVGVASKAGAGSQFWIELPGAENGSGSTHKRS